MYVGGGVGGLFLGVCCVVSGAVPGAGMSVAMCSVCVAVICGRLLCCCGAGLGVVAGVAGGDAVVSRVGVGSGCVVCCALVLVSVCCWFVCVVVVRVWLLGGGAV